MGKYKRKFKKVGQAYDVGNIVHAIIRGEWLYFNNKPMSPAWLQNWSIRQIQVAARNMQLFYAERTED